MENPNIIIKKSVITREKSLVLSIILTLINNWKSYIGQNGDSFSLAILRFRATGEVYGLFLYNHPNTLSKDDQNAPNQLESI